jgi:hypothetical protein
MAAKHNRLAIGIQRSAVSQLLKKGRSKALSIVSRIALKVIGSSLTVN